MEGPAVNNPEVKHTDPERAVPVNSTTVDSQLDGDTTIAIVEFYSSGCPVCAGLTWVIDSLAVTFGDSVLVGASNADTDTLWQHYGVSTVPTYILFIAGEEQGRYSFAENKPDVYDSLAARIRELIGGTFTPDTGDTVTVTDPANYITLDESSFDTTVLRKDVTALVFFLAPDDAPCITMDSVMNEIAPLFEERAVIAKVITWENPALCDRYGVSLVPQFLFFKDNTLREEHYLTGIVPGDTLIAHLEALLAEAPVDAPVLLDNGIFNDSITSDGRVAMVDFFSPTCPHCLHMDPIVNDLADSMASEALIAKVNVLENDSLVAAFGLIGWPTFIFFNNGVEYSRIEGSTTFTELAETIRSGLTGAHGKQ